MKEKESIGWEWTEDGVIITVPGTTEAIPFKFSPEIGLDDVERLTNAMIRAISVQDVLETAWRAFANGSSPNYKECVERTGYLIDGILMAMKESLREAAKLGDMMDHDGLVGLFTTDPKAMIRMAGEAVGVLVIYIENKKSASVPEGEK